jgi:FMN phosphatase YigB (HAD superfamily)
MIDRLEKKSTNFPLKTPASLAVSLAIVGAVQRPSWLQSAFQPKIIIFDINGVLLDSDEKLISAGVRLVQKCAQAGHRIMILSNSGVDTIGHMFVHYYDELVKYIKPTDIFIPEITRAIKPFDQAYKFVLEAIAKDPLYVEKKPSLFFIDDSKMNVEAAQKNGIYALHLANRDYGTIERELQLLGCF